MKRKKTFSTDREVANLKLLPGEKQAEYRHKKEQGLFLRISSRKKSWMVDYTSEPSHKRRRMKIGEYPAMGLAEAVRTARKVQTDAKERAFDPLAERQKQKEAPTVQTVMDFYLEEKGWGEKHPVSRMFERNVTPRLGKIKATDITRQDIKKLHREIAARGAEVMANRVLESLSAAFNVAEEEELIAHNPYPSIKKIKAKEKPRERILLNHEIRPWWEGTEYLSSSMRDILQLLLLLGQRSTETMKMRKEDIDIDRREYYIRSEDAKNDQGHLVPLPPLAWSIIEPRLENDGWLFPLPKHLAQRKGAKGQRITSTDAGRAKLKELTGITGWTAHDLRRTCRSLMSREGVPKHIAEITINHKMTKLERTYDRYEYIDEKRDALQRVENAIRQIIGQEVEPETKSGKIIQLRRIV